MDEDDLWRGTSDTVAVIRKRAAATTPSQRWLWWEDSLDIAADTGVLAEVRARRQAEADRWWAETTPDAPRDPISPPPGGAAPSQPR